MQTVGIKRCTVMCLARMSMICRSSLWQGDTRLRPVQSLGRKPVLSGGSGEPKRDGAGDDRPGASAAESMDSLVDEITKKEARLPPAVCRSWT